MEIKQDYTIEIEQQATKLMNGLLKTAECQWQEMHAKRTDITPTKAKQLAKDYAILFLAQELQFRISKNMNTDK